MVTVVQRRATLDVRISGVSIGHVRSAEWSGGFTQPYNEAKVVVSSLPGGFDNNQTLEIIAGNGTNHVTRFLGLARSPVYDLMGTITIQGFGNLVKAYEYENSEDTTLAGENNFAGGLFLEDLMGSPTATDADVVSAVLSRAGVSFSGGNIGGTGVTFGLGTITDSDDAFLWQSGSAPEGLPETQSAGETALNYIYRWDQISAVHNGPYANEGDFFDNSTGATTAPVGFYRTMETMDGTVVRVLIGGRPRGTPSIATPFIEGVDIRPPSSITRAYPRANRFLAVGYDDGTGPVRFVVQSSNPYMGSNKFTAPTISSPMIEKQAEVDWPDGMSCEKVARAQEPDYNRIQVNGTIYTSRDDYVSPGATILVQAAGGLPGRLGTGENVWVQSVRGTVSMQGFIQSFGVAGGGVPDNFLPAVPQ